MAFADLADGLA